jgi:hypothetical protein
MGVGWSMRLRGSGCVNWAGTMGLGILAMVVGVGLGIPYAHAANIITFGDNANSCGGAVMCSTNGTTGYLINGTGQAFNLTTIGSWFQIDTTGVNELATQTMAEPNGGAGAFLVTNNTGSTVTTFSLTINDSFWSGTPSVTSCSGSSGPLCDVFQANKGSGSPGGASETLSGPDLFRCTSPNNANPCTSSSGGVAAMFIQGIATYTWNGLNIAPNAKFDISFASWNNAVDSPVATPLPAALPLFATGLSLMGFLARRRKRKGAANFAAA